MFQSQDNSTLEVKIMFFFIENLLFFQIIDKEIEIKSGEKGILKCKFGKKLR